jgi:type IV pilus assembly protein PilP
VKQLAAAVVLVLVAALMGCQDAPPQGPTADEYRAERARVQAQREQIQQRQQKRPPPSPSVPQVEPDGTMDGAFAALAEDYLYNLKGRRDPFETYRHSAGPEETSLVTPLMNYELEQLAVVAVVWDTVRPRAVIADPRGVTYVVKEGTSIGKNDGQLIHIGDNLVLVKETYVDFAGEVTTKDVELRIRRSQGG